MSNFYLELESSEFGLIIEPETVTKLNEYSEGGEFVDMNKLGRF